MHNTLRLKRLGIDTFDDFIIFMRKDCHICRAEGFTSHARVKVAANGSSVVATLNMVSSDILAPGQAGLSECAWQHLNVQEGAEVSITHAQSVDSLGRVRAKVFGHRLSDEDFRVILKDVVSGYYSDIQLSSFITACAARELDEAEIVGLTSAMISAGKRMHWSHLPIVDKHCVGGLPGNRTTPIVVAVVAACGLTMPKTSSRAITSPAGTADTMETLAPVELQVAQMRRVVEQEGGCIVWGGSVELSPADDTLIRVERALDLDSQGQLIASVLSKKVAAGSTHLVIDAPVGSTAKIRSGADAAALIEAMTAVGTRLGLKLQVIPTDGRQPVGRGIGPALEAFDVLAVLQNAPDAPADLRQRALALAGALLELADAAPAGTGVNKAEQTLASGAAWQKFQAICAAQGGMRQPPRSSFQHSVLATAAGKLTNVDNRLLSRAAKLCGAPDAKAAGMQLHVALDAQVRIGQPLFTLHAQTHGELQYARHFIDNHPPIYTIEPVLG
jgi:thymidine phosphorylase